jgi:hypothetical protein
LANLLKRKGPLGWRPRTFEQYLIPTHLPSPSTRRQAEIQTKRQPTRGDTIFSRPRVGCRKSPPITRGQPAGNAAARPPREYAAASVTRVLRHYCACMSETAAQPGTQICPFLRHNAVLKARFEVARPQGPTGVPKADSRQRHYDFIRAYNRFSGTDCHFAGRLTIGASGCPGCSHCP